MIIKRSKFLLKFDSFSRIQKNSDMRKYLHFNSFNSSLPNNIKPILVQEFIGLPFVTTNDYIFSYSHKRAGSALINYEIFTVRIPSQKCWHSRGSAIRCTTICRMNVTNTRRMRYVGVAVPNEASLSSFCVTSIIWLRICLLPLTFCTSHE